MEYTLVLDVGSVLSAVLLPAVFIHVLLANTRIKFHVPRKFPGSKQLFVYSGIAGYVQWTTTPTKHGER